MTLGEKLLAIHAELETAGFEHAFGGAIALAYWTKDPRGTSNIDVNIFVTAGEAADALAALPDGIAFTDRDLAEIKSTGQVRLWWDETPVDLYFAYERLHEEAARHRREGAFGGKRIPVLGPIELAVFKAVFDRTRDWADIEAMVTAETLDVAAVRKHLTELLGEDDERLARLDEAVVRGDAARGD